MLETKAPEENKATEEPKVTIIGIAAKRKQDPEDDSIKKQRNEESETVKDKVAACHTIESLAKYVRTLSTIQGRAEKFTGEFIAKLIMTPNINPNMITNTYNIRKQFMTIANHTYNIRDCKTIDELLTYLETNLSIIPTSATKEGTLSANRLIKLIKELAENKELIKAVPSAYGLREVVTKLINNTSTLKL